MAVSMLKMLKIWFIKWTVKGQILPLQKELEPTFWALVLHQSYKEG